jgi:hypothetical protein
MKRTVIGLLVTIFAILLLVPGLASAQGSKARQVIGACTTQESLVAEATIAIIRDIAQSMQKQDLVRRCDQLLDVVAELDRMQNQINATQAEMNIKVQEQKKEILISVP